MLKPKQTLDEVIHHEVKETGTHMWGLRTISQFYFHFFLCVLNTTTLPCSQISLRSYIFKSIIVQKVFQIPSSKAVRRKNEILHGGSEYFYTDLYARLSIFVCMWLVFQSDDVYLEAQIQNITNGPICLEKVTLETTDYFKGTCLCVCVW